MADLSIVKIKVRRGTNSDRLRVVLDEGELGFTTDTNRLFVGDGNTIGGINISNNFLGYGDRTTFGRALISDMVYDINQNNLFVLSALPTLSANNWVNVGPKTDNNTVFYNVNYKLEVVDHSIGRLKLNTPDVLSTGLSSTIDYRIVVSFDNNTIKHDGTYLYVDPGVLPLSSFKQSPLGGGVDASTVRLAGITTVPGLTAIPGPVYNVLSQNQIFLLNEPPGTQAYYLMVKA
jgi:hypothetical protein